MELAELERFLSPVDEDLRLLTPYEVRDLLDRIEVLRRAVAARRRYRPAARRLADVAYAGVIDDSAALNEEDRKNFEVVVQLAQDFIDPEDKTADIVVDKLRKRLEGAPAVSDDPQSGENLVEVLENTLRSTTAKQYHGFKAAADELTRILRVS
jgi:hypothetical protein